MREPPCSIVPMNEQVEPIALWVESRSLAATREAWKDAARRSLYLLDPECPIPVSFDRRVLPLSVGGEATEHTLRLVARAVVRGAAMRKRAFGLVATWDEAPPVGPIPLGYDVGDGSVSLLMNAGFADDEARERRRTWRPRVNAVGLFEHLEDAQRYADFCDIRVPEHAPAWVIELSTDEAGFARLGQPPRCPSPG